MIFTPCLYGWVQLPVENAQYAPAVQLGPGARDYAEGYIQVANPENLSLVRLISENQDQNQNRGQNQYRDYHQKGQPVFVLPVVGLGRSPGLGPSP